MQPEVEYLTAWFLTSQLFDAVRYHIQRDRDLRNSYFCGDPIVLSNTIQVASRFGGGRAARRPSSKPIQLRTGEAVFMIVEGAARNQLENVRHMPLKRPIANASEQSHILCETIHFRRRSVTGKPARRDFGRSSVVSPSANPPVSVVRVRR